jgi:hypothetical protein
MFKVNVGGQDGILRIQLESFENPGGRVLKGPCCDRIGGYCQVNGCDHFFDMCLDDVASAQWVI